MPAVAPIKVSSSTDALISHAAHFLSTSKKDVVEVAVQEYIDRHRDEINASVQNILREINGSDAAAVSALSGLSAQELDDLGGLPN